MRAASFLGGEARKRGSRTADGVCLAAVRAGAGGELDGTGDERRAKDAESDRGEVVGVAVEARKRAAIDRRQRDQPGDESGGPVGGEVRDEQVDQRADRIGDQVADVEAEDGDDRFRHTRYGAS